MLEAGIKTERLSYRIGGRNIIQDVSLKFKPGVLYGILGPNGAGKTTFLKLLNGIWTPTGGSVFWNGEDLHSKSREEISRTIAFVPQNLQIPFEFNVAQFVAMGRYPHRNESNPKEEIIENCLHTVDAWDLREKPLNQLSSGERQRVYIARALATDAPVILLDEPTACLDIRHQLEIWRLFHRLKARGKLLIATLHDIPSAECFCDELMIFHHGNCVAQGCFQTIINEDVFQQVFGVVENTTHAARRFELGIVKK